MNDTAHGYTIGETAARLRLSEKTVRNRIKSGAIPAQKFNLPAGGVAWQIDRHWVDSGAVPVTGSTTGAAGPPITAPAPERQNSIENSSDASYLKSEKVQIPTGALPERNEMSTGTVSSAETATTLPDRQEVTGTATDPVTIATVPALPFRLPERDPVTSNLATHQDIEPLRRDIEQIKAFMAGDMAAQFRTALAEIPNRDDLRGAVNDALAGVESRVGESLANLTLQMEQIAQQQTAGLTTDDVSTIVQQQLAPLLEKQTQDATKIEDLQQQLAEAKAQAERRAAIVPPPVINKPWWKIWG